MDEQTIFNIMTAEGYHLLDRLHAHSPGYAGLLVAIRNTPTRQHFDPEAIELCLSEPNQKVRPVKLTLTLSFTGVRQVYPGKIILHDRIDKRVYFFVYGGTLEAASRNGATIYVLRSPAPILVMSNGLASVPEQLASKTEAFLAEMHARWGQNDQGFIQYLTQADPLWLYAAIIRSILNTYQQKPSLRESYHALYETLLSEKEWLIQLGQWSTQAPGLADFWVNIPTESGHQPQDSGTPFGV
jgi:hypothetical protein